MGAPSRVLDTSPAIGDVVEPKSPVTHIVGVETERASAVPTNNRIGSAFKGPRTPGGQLDPAVSSEKAARTAGVKWFGQSPATPLRSFDPVSSCPGRRPESTWNCTERSRLLAVGVGHRLVAVVEQPLPPLVTVVADQVL